MKYTPEIRYRCVDRHRELLDDEVVLAEQSRAERGRGGWVERERETLRFASEDLLFHCAHTHYRHTLQQEKHSLLHTRLLFPHLKFHKVVLTASCFDFLEDNCVIVGIDAL